MNPLTLLRCGTVVLFVAALLTGPVVAKGQTAPDDSKSGQTNTQQAPKTEQAYRLPPDKLAKAITLNKIRLVLEIAGTFWGLAVLWLLLATKVAARMGAWVQSVSRFRWIQGLIFFALFFVITTLASLPLDATGHAVSRHYEISVQGWGSWFGDQGKALGLTVGIGSLVMLLFNWIVRRWPRGYWLIAWAVTIPLMALGTLSSPFVERIFDQFEPLAKSDPALVQDLEKVVARTGTDIPPDRMFLMKASVKTNGLNAYVSGLGATKRIVVWDTTAGRIPNDQVMFIFGHETGHYVLHHIVRGMIASAAGLFVLYWLCSRFAAWLVRRFGSRWGIAEQDGIAPIATRAGFLVLVFAVSLASLFVEPVGNAFSRYLEHQADVYGQEAIHGLVPDPQLTAISAFNHLGEAWLEDPAPNPFVEFWLYSHPSVKNRANFAAHYNPWAKGGHGQFFKQ